MSTAALQAVPAGDGWLAVGGLVLVGIGLLAAAATWRRPARGADGPADGVPSIDRVPSDGLVVGDDAGYE